MTRCRVVVDLEFRVDDDVIKAAALSLDDTGVADVSDGMVRDLVSTMLIGADWSAHGVRPLRSIVTPRTLSRAGWYDALHLSPDRGFGL